MSDGGKVCERCKADVSGKPRTKDKRGRYFCADCVKALRAKRAASAASADGAGEIGVAPPAVSAPGNVMAALVDDAVSHLGAPCPSCQSPMPQGAVICTRCGHNMASGKNMKTRVTDAPKEKKVKSSDGSGPNVTTIVTTLSVVGLCGLFGLGFVNPMLFLVFFLVFGLFALVVYIALVATAFMDGYSGWGMALIFLTWIPLIGWLIELKYLFEVCERVLIRNLMVVSWVIAFASGLAIRFMGDDMFAGMESTQP